jgi:biopolymer transport protein ExbB/TolQ
MNSLYFAVTQLFYQLSVIFFWPVVIALLALFAVSLLDLGALLYRAWRKRQEPATDLGALARRLAEAVSRTDDGRNRWNTDSVRMPPGIRRFWNRLTVRLDEAGSQEDLDLWLEECLQQEEIELTSRLDGSRALIRIGPMLGLAGTIIPLGPALHSLLSGNMAEMVNHLVVGFGAVVCGLVLSGLAYFVTLVRERWTRVELKDMENLCELLLRTMRREELSRHASFSKA